MCLEFSKLGPGALSNKAFGAISIGGLLYGGQSTALQQMIMWAHQVDMHVVSCGSEVGTICGGYLGASGATCQSAACARIFRGRGPVDHPSSQRAKGLIREDECCKLQCEYLGKRVVDMAKITKADYSVVPREELYWAKGKIVGGWYKYGDK
jgi:hypothetical protein